MNIHITVYRVAFPLVQRNQVALNLMQPLNWNLSYHHHIATHWLVDGQVSTSQLHHPNGTERAWRARQTDDHGLYLLMNMSHH